MQILKKIGLSLCLIFLSVTTNASSSNQLMKLLSNVHTLQATFTQDMLDKNGKVIQQSIGTMALNRPGKLRWEVKKPTSQVVIANDSRIWIYDPDLDQVTIRTLSKEVGATPALFLSNSQASLDQNFHVQELKNNVSTMRWFSLKPKDKSNMLSEIKVGFLNNQLHTMKLLDQLGHATVIQFENIKIDSPLSKNLFTFTPPPKVDVIDETRQG